MVESPEADQESLITWLAERDTPCPLCSYNLRGLTTPRCPECGQPLVLSVALAEPYLKAWIATLVGLLPPAGIGVFLIFGFLYGLATEGSRVFQGLNYITPGQGFLILHASMCVPLSIVALIVRRRFLAWPRPMQAICAFSAWGAVFVSVIILLSYIR